MQHFGIIAHPVAHSLSPLMYEAGFTACGLDADFLKFDVMPEELGSFLRNMRAGTMDLTGCAVSLPHKQACMAFLDAIDPVAAEIGAVNTILCANEGSTPKLIGYNTDHLGARSALDTALVQNRKHITTPKWKRVLLVGAGGMAAAVAHALRDVGAHTFIWNRTPEKAHAMAKRFGAEIVRDPVDGHDLYDLVIQATSVGLERDESPLPIHFWENHGNGIALDMVYSPRMTRFLRDAERAGWDVVTGEHALVGQAVEQFRLLTGEKVSPETFFDPVFANLK